MSDAKPELESNAREHTDESLQKERSKADKVLDYRLIREADEALDLIRDDADATKLEQRDATDATSKTVDPRLLKEREVTDATLDTERREVDLSIERERAHRRATERARHYNAERLATNSNLATEREEVDNEVTRSTWRLTEEQAAHEDTRLALTTRDELLAILSHDLRSPLCSVLAGADLLTKHSERGTDFKASQRYISSIQRSANGMLRLINDLLDAERFASGNMQLAPGKHDLRELVQLAVVSLEPMAISKAQVLSADLPPLPVYVSCDNERIMQVMTNLLGNALKFTPEGGAVVISVTSAAGRGQVSVSDTGPGIAAAERDRIFERFSRLPSPERSGLGLGLWIAKKIIAAHEGRLWVASAVGEGSVFSFALRLTS